jgi:hypothetical protein
VAVVRLGGVVTSCPDFDVCRSMPAFYSIYGLRLEVDEVLPGLLPSDQTAPPDVRISLGGRASWLSTHATVADELQYASAARDGHGVPTVTIRRAADGSHYRFVYADGTEFHVDGRGSRVWARWPADLTLEDTATYLLGPILGFVLRLHGITCLHASAVVVDRHAVALVGPAGAGKSTTAAAFARLGFPVLADDVVTVREEGGALLVHPAYAYLRLWPDSAALLFGSPEALPRLTPTWDKRCLQLAGAEHRFQREPLPLGALYLLGRRETGAQSPQVEPVGGQAGVLALVANTYATRVSEPSMGPRELRALGRILAAVPLRRVTAGDDPSQLPALCETIVADFRVRRAVEQTVALTR